MGGGGCRGLGDVLEWAIHVTEALSLWLVVGGGGCLFSCCLCPLFFAEFDHWNNHCGLEIQF